MARGKKVRSFGECSEALEELRVEREMQKREEAFTARSERRKEKSRIFDLLKSIEDQCKMLEEAGEDASSEREKANELKKHFSGFTFTPESGVKGREQRWKKNVLEARNITAVMFRWEDNTATKYRGDQKATFLPVERNGIPHSGLVSSIAEKNRVLWIRLLKEDGREREFCVKYSWLDHEYGEETRNELVKLAIRRGTSVWHSVDAPPVMQDAGYLFQAIGNTMEKSGAFLESFYGRQEESEEKNKGGRPKGYILDSTGGYYWDGLKWAPVGKVSWKEVDRQYRKDEKKKGKRKSHAKRKLSTRHKKSVGVGIGLASPLRSEEILATIPGKKKDTEES